MSSRDCAAGAPSDDRATALLRATAEGTARATGPEFFATAVAVLADALQIHAATISIPVPDRPGWHRLVEGAIQGEPLELPDIQVLRLCPEPVPNGRILVSPDDFRVVRDDETPSNADALTWFAAIDLVDTTGDVLGHLGLGHISPVTFTPAEEDSLRIFAARIAGELERELAEADLRATADLRERIIATAPIGVAHLDLHSRQGWSNKRAIDLLGPSFDITSPEEHGRLLHPDDREEFELAQQRLLTFGDPIDLDIRILQPSGAERWVQLHAGAGFDLDGKPREITALLIDRTDERTAAAARADYNAELEGSLDAFADTHFQLGADGTYLAVRSRVGDREVEGWATVVGSNVVDRYPPLLAQRILDAISATLAGDDLLPIRYTVQLDDGPTHYEARFAPLARDRVIMVKRDATDIHRLEQQLVHAAAMQSVGRLAGGIAHDFNNVLHVIRGHAAALERHADDPASTRKRIDAITAAVDRTTTLVDQLMQISRPAPGLPTASPVDDFLEHIGFGLTRMLTGDVELEFRFNAPGVAVIIDDSQFENVILNLVANATDAMPHGGTITISTRTGGASNVVIEVTDDGDGMDAETTARAFEPLFTTKPPGIGTGLGLATSYSTVTDAGGTMLVQSAPGVGTTFTIVLPVTDDEKHVDAQPAVRPSTIHDETLLVVDDDEDVLELCSGALRDAGFTVVEAHDGKAALEVIERGRHVDLVLTDVTMPRMSGIELAQQVRVHSPDLPIVFMTGFTSDHQTPPDGEEAVPVLRKPFSDDALIAAVQGRLTT